MTLDSGRVFPYVHYTSYSSESGSVTRERLPDRSVPVRVGYRSLPLVPASVSVPHALPYCSQEPPLRDYRLEYADRCARKRTLFLSIVDL